MRYLNVIIIDDDPDDCEIFEQAIKEVYPSATCTVYNDAEKALLSLSESAMTSGIIFLDLNMPRMDGVQFLQEMNDMEHLRDVPVIIFSTSPLIEVSKSRLVNIKGLLEKPESYEALVDRLKQMLV